MTERAGAKGAAAEGAAPERGGTGPAGGKPPGVQGGRVPGGIDAVLPWLLRRVNQRFRFAIRDRLAARGFEELPQPGYWALMVLARGGTDAGQLIAEMGVTKQAVSKLVDTLVTSGFVERRVNEADRRRTDLLLSDKGRRAVAVIADAVRATEEDFTGTLGAERFTDLVGLLEQLART